MPTPKGHVSMLSGTPQKDRGWLVLDGMGIFVSGLPDGKYDFLYLIRRTKANRGIIYLYNVGISMPDQSICGFVITLFGHICMYAKVRSGTYVIP